MQNTLRFKLPYRQDIPHIELINRFNSIRTLIYLLSSPLGASFTLFNPSDFYSLQLSGVKTILGISKKLDLSLTDVATILDPYRYMDLGPEGSTQEKLTEQLKQTGRFKYISLLECFEALAKKNGPAPFMIMQDLLDAAVIRDIFYVNRGAYRGVFQPHLTYEENLQGSVTATVTFLTYVIGEVQKFISEVDTEEFKISYDSAFK